MEFLTNLNEEERRQILLAPVFISLLAANADGELDKDEKAMAIKLTHCKTFTSDPELLPYYKEVEKEFEKNVDYFDEKYPKIRSVREKLLDEELQKLTPIIKKMGDSWSDKFYASLKSYNKHVSRAHWNVPNETLVCFELEGLEAA